MADKQPNPRAEKLVRAKEPTAFVGYCRELGGYFVKIKIREIITSPCPHCWQEWTRSAEKVRSFGCGENSDWAWHYAAVSLGLIKK